MGYPTPGSQPPESRAFIIYLVILWGVLPLAMVTWVITGATVLFLMAGDAGSFSEEATVVDEAAGTYQPGSGFPTTPGDYRQEWEVTFADDRILTFPNDKYNKVTIIEDLN